MRTTIITAVFACLLLVMPASAQPADSISTYTLDHPLVYEDSWDLWPYVFLDEEGNAVGYNVDLLRLLLSELDIPYIIKLKPTTAVLHELKEGHVDLTCGMDDAYHREFAGFGRSVIQMFTHSLVHQKDRQPVVSSVNDLVDHKVIVHDGSFCHHLMIQHGWRDNAIPRTDMREAIQQAHDHADMQILWNTMSLKWLVQTMNFDNLQLTPVTMPHGEYKFMSHDRHLLHQLDSVYVLLESSGQLETLKNKWFYPEYSDSGIPSWIWRIVAFLVLLIAVALVVYAVYLRQEKEMTSEIRRSNKRLALILKTSRVNIWVYNLRNRTITRYNDEAQEILDDRTPREFFGVLEVTDMARVAEAFQQIVAKKKDHVTLDVRDKGDEQGRFRYMTLCIDVLRRDRRGNPVELLGTTSDVTKDHHRQQEVKDNMLRYQSIFNSAMVDTVTYDAEGYITDMNEKACASFPGGKAGALKNRVNLREVLGDSTLDMDKLQACQMTRVFEADSDQRVFDPKQHQGRYYELQLVPVRDADGRLLTVFGTGRDISEMVHSYQRVRKNIEELEQLNDSMNDYIRNIDYVLQNGGVRMVNYSPVNHTVTISQGIGQVQNSLTQTRAMFFTDDDFKKTALRLFTNMDNRVDSLFTATIKTTLRAKNGHRLYLYFSFVPTLDADGRVVEYFGMCRDISDIKATEEELAHETARAQEVETVKNAFLRNMSYEIRTPLNSVVGFAELFSMEHNTEDEPFFIDEIKNNSAHLLKLINDILYLSRLDAHMIDIKPQPIDFAEFFAPRCQAAWYNGPRPAVDFVTDNPYQRLVIDIDSQNLGNVMEQIIVNAAEHTTEGQVRVSYVYTGEELVITFQDTGSGISEDRMAQIFERFVSTGGRGTGLGLSICREMVQQMGGKINIKSAVGQGTIVWVSIPCKCTEIVSK